MDRNARWLWAGWGLSVLFGFLAPLRRVLFATKGSGSLPIYAAIALMVAIWSIVRRRPQAFFSALLMNASGLSLGAALAFLSLWTINHKPLQVIFGLKWIVFGTILTVTFARQMRKASAPFPEYRGLSLDGLSTEEARAKVLAEIEGFAEASNFRIRQGNRLLVLGIVFSVAAGGMIFFLVTKDAFSPSLRSFLMAICGTVLLVTTAGVWRVQNVRRPPSS